MIGVAFLNEIIFMIIGFFLGHKVTRLFFKGKEKLTKFRK